MEGCRGPRDWLVVEVWGKLIEPLGEGLAEKRLGVLNKELLLFDSYCVHGNRTLMHILCKYMELQLRPDCIISFCFFFFSL